MFYTTRNPKEAELFIERLPITEEEKAEIKSYLPAMNEFMNEIKLKKSLNSKGGEFWINTRVEEKIKETQSIYSRFFSGLDCSHDGLMSKLLLIQASITSEILQIGIDAGVSNQTLVKVNQYCDFLSDLSIKYSFKNEFDE